MFTLYNNTTRSLYLYLYSEPYHPVVLYLMICRLMQGAEEQAAVKGNEWLAVMAGLWETVTWEGPKPQETVLIVDENEASGDFFLVVLMAQALRQGKKWKAGHCHGQAHHPLHHPFIHLTPSPPSTGRSRSLPCRCGSQPCSL